MRIVVLGAAALIGSKTVAVSAPLALAPEN
jgi:hypothetical protein